MARQDFQGRENAGKKEGRVRVVQPDRKEGGHAREVKVTSLGAAHR